MNQTFGIRIPTVYFVDFEKKNVGWFGCLLQLGRSVFNRLAMRSNKSTKGIPNEMTITEWDRSSLFQKKKTEGGSR